MENKLEGKMPIDLPAKGVQRPADRWTEFFGLEPEDFDALRLYDPANGHLLKYDTETGAMDGHSIKILNEKGLLKRLLSHGLILSGGKLTEKGVRFCEELVNEDRRQTHASQLQEARPLRKAPRDKLRKNRVHEAGISSDQSTEKKDRDSKVKVIFSARGVPDDETFSFRTLAGNEIQGADESLVSLSSQQLHEAEQFKMLKTCILYPPSGKPPRSILITSVEPRDGKSFVAANLAISIAQNLNQHVLLIDCDLRKPCINRLFGIGDAPGLSEYLCESRALRSLLQKTEVERLCILPAGRRPKNPAELLSSARMASLIKEVTLRYRDRLVVIDSPPSTLTAEPAVLARQAEAVLMVIRYGKTRMTDLHKTVIKLGKDKVIGCVINQHEPSIREYYGYKRYPGYGPSPK